MKHENADVVPNYDLNNGNQKDNEVDKAKFKHAGKTYYKSKKTAQSVRRRGERVSYSSKQKAYRVVRPKEKSIWEKYLGW